MYEFQDILYQRRNGSDILWVARNWDPVCAYVQTKKSNPNDIKNKALVGTHLRNILAQLSRAKNLPMDALHKTARALLEEIAYDRAVSVLRVLAWITSKLTKSLLFGINVNVNKFLTIRSEFGKNPVLLVPSHRSYGDFILMSFICFHFDVDIPRIAAGVDFQAMSVTSSILRKACAFFMRRSFNSDKIYTAVFEEYVNALITDGDASVEFFIEGTRSRTGKALMPKFGFLKMALKSYFTAMVPDVTILPISFSYDRVMEERLFAYELLGIPKPKESTKGLFRAYAKILNEKLGYVNVNFGDPISVKEFFGYGVDRSIHNFGPVALQEITSDESKQISRLAHAIIQEQKKLTVITCFNLMATIINQHVSESCVPLSLQELVSEVEWLQSVMTELGAIVTIEGNLSESVSNYIKLHKYFLIVDTDENIKLLLNPTIKYTGEKFKMKGHCLRDETMAIAVPFLMLQFYSNPCAPFLVNLCFVALIVHHEGTRTLFVDELFKQFQFLRSVFSHEFVLRAETEQEDFAAAVEYAKNKKVIVQTGLQVKPGENEKLSRLFVSYIRLYISSYVIIMDVLLEEYTRLVSQKEISRSYQNVVERLIIENIQIHPASLSLNLVDNAMQGFLFLRGLKNLRRRQHITFRMYNHELKVIRGRLGKYGGFTKLKGKISQHMENFLQCKY